jgi:glycosyltransferase involved in cell wall biosynthesis
MGLRVLHVIGGGDSGGAMSHLLPLLSALQRAGCDVHLLCLGEGRLAEEASCRGSSVAVLEMRHAWDASVIGPLRRILAGGPADLEAAPGGGAGYLSEHSRLGRLLHPRWDVVHTHGMRANLPVRLVLRGRHIFNGRQSGPCLFTTVHSDLRLDYSSSGQALLYQRLDRATLPAVDRIICVSEALRRLLLERGYPAERLLTIRSGIELPEICVSEASTPEAEVRADSAADAAKTLAATRAGTRVGTIARLVPVKDVDLLLEVAGLLRRTQPEVEVVIVGGGPERGRLEERARSLGLGGVVRFTGRRDDVGVIMDGLDVYMVTSTFEGGVSMAVLEAMAAGIPVVTTAAGGVEEAVRDGETGFVVTRQQERAALAAALADRAAVLLADPQLRARMGAAGARRVRDAFAVERTAQATLRIYERCLAARGALSQT